MPYSTEKVMARINSLLKHPPENISGRIIDNHVVLDIIGEEVHYWSPQLNFRVEPDEEDENKAVLSGLIGPRPSVWTLFTFFYFATGFIGFFIASFGFSKLMLGEYSHMIWAFPLAILFMLTAYSAGKRGEKLAKGQIEQLKQFVRDAIFFEQE